MTNQEIIFSEAVRLMKEKEILGSGIFDYVKLPDDSIVYMELPEEIHTYQAWKELGFQVKKGETSKIKIKIWKHSSKKRTDEDGNEIEYDEKMFQKTASFFTIRQVEAI